MLQRSSKVKPGAKAIEDFKKGADSLPEIQEEKPEMKKIGQWVKKENWERLQRIRLDRTMAGDKVTLNTLLDEAIEMIWGFHTGDGTRIEQIERISADKISEFQEKRN
jgi:hypothetical protein